MELTIPGPREAHTEQITTLDGVQYVIAFDWIQRWRRWVLSLSTTGGAPIVSGLPVVTGVDLLGPFKHDTRIPQGVLIVADESADNHDPTWGDFGPDGSHVLYYFGDG